MVLCFKKLYVIITVWLKLLQFETNRQHGLWEGGVNAPRRSANKTIDTNTCKFELRALKSFKGSVKTQICH